MQGRMFSVGDRVVNKKSGRTGTIVSLDDSFPYALVEIDRKGKRIRSTIGFENLEMITTFHSQIVKRALALS